jgi:hypothetical protein
MGFLSIIKMEAEKVFLAPDGDQIYTPACKLEQGMRAQQATLPEPRLGKPINGLETQRFRNP